MTIMALQTFRHPDTLVQLPMKKALRETRTLRAGRSNAEPKKNRPTADPMREAQDRQNLISGRWSLPAPIDPV